MKTVFLDANVLWSAARAPEKIPWNLISGGAADFSTSHYCAAEARRNLPPENHASLEKLLGKIRLVSDAFAPPPAGVRLPAKDFPVLASAALAKADLLVTGDNDFSAYFGRTLGGVKIILPRNLAQELK